MSSVFGCILAGGLARRMSGGDKGLLTIDNRSILDWVVERLRPQCGDIAINANGDPARFASTGLAVVSDPVAGHVGPLAGILAGMMAAHDRGYDFVATVATDTPFFPRDLVARLAAAAEGNDIACAASGGRQHPVIGLWPTRLADDLRHAIDAEKLRKVQEWLSHYRLGVASWPNHPFDPFFNVNRPDDLIEARRIAQDHAP
ncbi:molybdenum cofactor guanylyltransferase MobA [soil metagenome]